MREGKYGARRVGDSRGRVGVGKEGPVLEEEGLVCK